MSDIERLRVVKDLSWNIGMYIIALALLAFGYLLGAPLIDREHVTESLKIIAAAEAIPVFFVIAAYNRISGEIIGALLGAIMGFALGKIG